MAGLSPNLRTDLARLGAAIALAAAVAAAGLSAPGAALADDPTQEPEPPRAATCAERYPEQGPAGVDLRLGCIVSELVGLYTAGQQAPPPPLSAYAIGLIAAIAGGVAVIWFAGRLVARRAGRRLAPVVPGEWWACATCHSVNGAGKARCYACGAPPPDGPTMTTQDRPEIPQSFGSGRKRG